jgi:hypothetical protein
MSLRPRRRSRILAAAALLGMSGASVNAAAENPGRGDQGPMHGAPEEQQDVKELQVAPPAYPRDSNLVEFKLRGQTANRFSIDTSTLSVGKDRVIRFVLVIRTPSGEKNVRFSGLRCNEREWKDYAFAGDDRNWRVDERAEWKRMQELSYNNYQSTLHKDFFCIGGGSLLGTEPAGDAQKLAKLLKKPMREDPRVNTYRSDRH